MLAFVRLFSLVAIVFYVGNFGDVVARVPCRPPGPGAPLMGPAPPRGILHPGVPPRALSQAPPTAAAGVVSHHASGYTQCYFRYPLMVGTGLS